MILDLLYGPEGWFTHCQPPEWWNAAMAENCAPFPWFGGKSKIADLVWERFGDVKNYVEPFAGSMAVLLGRPHASTIETVNDFDGFVSNFWRAVRANPDAVADFADWPVNETDLHTRHKWLVKRKAMLRARLLEDPTFYDARIAGWWVWGLCAWIGSGWCTSDGERKDGTLQHRMPEIGSGTGSPKEGRGIHSKSMRTKLPELVGGKGGANAAKHGKGVHAAGMRLPHLGAGTGGEDDHACAHYGKGVHGKGMRLLEQLPVLSRDGQGVASATNRSRLHEVFRAIAQRLRYTRITCGDFERILSPAVTWRHGTTGVFLDPPYPSDAGSTGGIYSSDAHERETFARAFRYCLEHGANKDLRIALCYYEGTTVRPAPIDGVPTEGPAEDVSHALRSLGWDVVPWKAGGGYGRQSGRGNDNASRERVAFSPHCLRARQATLF